MIQSEIPLAQQLEEEFRKDSETLEPQFTIIHNNIRAEYDIANLNPRKNPYLDRGVIP